MSYNSKIIKIFLGSLPQFVLLFSPAAKAEEASILDNATVIGTNIYYFSGCPDP